jgi:Holliday junction resolvase
MPNKSRVKGDCFEREVVHALLAGDVDCQRVPLSGAAKGRFGGDIQASICGLWQKLECKIRQRAWLDLYGWIEDNYALVIRRNAEPGKPIPDTLVVLRLADFITLSKGIL